MNQDNNPKFTHITIGNATYECSDKKEEEEVIVIGSVVPVSDYEEQKEDAGHVVSQMKVAVDDAGKDGKNVFETDLQADGLSEEDLQITPMPLIQKLVLVACAIAFAVAIFLVVWYRIT